MEEGKTLLEAYKSGTAEGAENSAGADAKSAPLYLHNIKGRRHTGLPLHIAG